MRKCDRLFVSRVTGGNWGCGTRPTRRLRRLDRHYRRRPCRGDDRASPAIAAGFVASHVAPITTSATNTTASRISVEPSPPSGEKPKYRSINCIGPVRAFSAANTSAANTTLMVAKPTATPPFSIGHASLHECENHGAAFRVSGIDRRRTMANATNKPARNTRGLASRADHFARLIDGQKRSPDQRVQEVDLGPMSRCGRTDGRRTLPQETGSCRVAPLPELGHQSRAQRYNVNFTLACGHRLPLSTLPDRPFQKAEWVRSRLCHLNHRAEQLHRVTKVLTAIHAHRRKCERICSDFAPV